MPQSCDNELPWIVRYASCGVWYSTWWFVRSTEMPDAWSCESSAVIIATVLAAKPGNGPMGPVWTCVIFNGPSGPQALPWRNLTRACVRLKTVTRMSSPYLRGGSKVNCVPVGVPSCWAYSRARK